jgi:hypothetical protein
MWSVPSRTMKGDDMSEQLSTKEKKQKAGHYEILGETLAKFEFFQHGWHPYSRFLDVDKVDLILRRRNDKSVEYREVQVKFGKLYTCTRQWEIPLFSHSSWRFFTEKNLNDLTDRKGLHLAYVLSPDDGFKGDMFIFPIDDFAEIVRRSDRLGNGNYRVYISKTHASNPKWYVRRLPKFDSFDSKNVIDVTGYYRNFTCLD